MVYIQGTGSTIFDFMAGTSLSTTEGGDGEKTNYRTIATIPELTQEHRNLITADVS